MLLTNGPRAAVANRSNLSFGDVLRSNGNSEKAKWKVILICLFSPVEHR